MATPVPAIDRSMTILNYLAAKPLEEGVSLSRIARDVDIHKATAAAILAALTGYGLVRRTEDKLYRLGPEAVRLSHAYLRRHPGFGPANAEMVRLSEELGLSCMLSVVDGDEYVILEIVGDQHPSHLPVRPGMRMPLSPPAGSVFKVWGTPEEVDDWITRMAEEFGTDHESQLATIATIRARGYALGSEQDFDVQLESALRRLARHDDDSRGMSVAMMVADKIRNYDGAQDDEDAPVNYIVGPIFGPDQRVVMSIQLFGAPGQIRRRDVERYGRRLLVATEAVTRTIGGIPATSVLPTILS